MGHFAADLTFPQGSFQVVGHAIQGLVGHLMASLLAFDQGGEAEGGGEGVGLGAPGPVGQAAVLGLEGEDAADARLAELLEFRRVHGDADLRQQIPQHHQGVGGADRLLDAAVGIAHQVLHHAFELGQGGGRGHHLGLDRDWQTLRRQVDADGTDIADRAARDQGAAGAGGEHRQLHLHRVGVDAICRIGHQPGDEAHPSGVTGGDLDLEGERGRFAGAGGSLRTRIGSAAGLGRCQTQPLEVGGDFDLAALRGVVEGQGLDLQHVAGIDEARQHRPHQEWLPHHHPERFAGAGAAFGRAWRGMVRTAQQGEDQDDGEASHGGTSGVRSMGDRVAVIDDCIEVR